MKAVVVREFGKRPRIEPRALAELGPDDVRVRVEAVGLNFADLLMIRGTYQSTPQTPFTLGLELAGRVEEVGSSVGDLQIGDRVAAETAGGALAEWAVVRGSQCWHVPGDMPSEVAAGFQIAYGTSYLALIRRARLTSGDSLVVLGAAGGVGLTAVEIGAAAGARVIAVARGAEKLSIAQRAGAEHVLDASKDLRNEIKLLGGADVVYDAVGGDLGLAAFRSLKSEGRHLLIGFASGAVPDLKLNHALVKNIDLIGIYWGGYAGFAPSVRAECLSTLSAWYSEGRIAPRIETVDGLEAALPALDLLERRETTGKVVVRL